MTDFFSGETSAMIGLFVEVILKSTLLVAAAAIATFALRGATASLRHLLWSLTLVALLAIPGLMLVLPRWQLNLLPDRLSGIPVVVGNGTQAPLRELDPTGPIVAPLSPLRSPGEAAPVSPVVANPSIDVSNGDGSLIDSLALLWLGGLVAGLITIGGGLLTLRRISRRATRLESADWTALLGELTHGLGITREVRLLASHSAAMPSTWGVLHPVVLLPADADSWNEDRRRVVLMHELAHVKRNDCLTQLVAQLCCAVYWFHPGAWYTARKIRAERELACDEHVLGVGVNACDYAAHLLEVARDCRVPAGSTIAAIAMARPTQLEGRLLAILDRRVPSGWRASRAVRRASVVALSGLTLSLAAMRPWGAPIPAESGADTFRWKGQVKSGQWVEVMLLHGDIRAELSAGTDVEILAVRKSGDSRSYRIAVDTKGKGARFCAVAARSPNAGCETGLGGTLENGVFEVRVDFLVKVPPGVGVSLHTGRGNIAAEDLKSYVWGTAGQGDISITTSDLAEASTRVGSISAEFGRRTWKQNLEFLTDDGDVTVVAPSDASMMFEAVSKSGEARSEFAAPVRPFGTGQRVASRIGDSRGMLTLHSGRGRVELKRGGKAVAESSNMSVDYASAPRSSVDPKPNPNPNPRLDPNPNPNPQYNPDPNVNPHVDFQYSDDEDPTGERVPVTIPDDLIDRLSDAAIRGWADAAAIAQLRNIAASHVKQHAADLVSERAAWALTLIRNGEIVAPLRAALSNPDWRVRAYAAWALSQTRDPRGSAPLTAALSDSHWRVRMHAAAGLQRQGNAASVDPLIRALSDDYWQVRISAIDALAAIGDRRALAPLQTVAERDPRTMVREEAQSAIGRIR